MGTKLYVGNLSYDTTEDQLTELFSQDSREVASVSIALDRETARPRGFAFVEMGSDEDARAAIEALGGVELDGRTLRVDEARPRPASSSSRDRGGRHDRRW